MENTRRARSVSFFLARLKGSRAFSAVAESVVTGFVGQAFLLVSGIIVARLLGPDGRGYFALLALFPAMLAQLGLLGFPQSVTYLLARNRSDAPPLLHDMKAVFALQWFLVGVAHAVVLVAYTADKGPDIVAAAILTMISVPGVLMLAYGLSGLQGLQMYREFNVLRSLVPAGWALVALILFFTEQVSLPVVAGAWAVVQIVAGLLAYVAFTKHARQESPSTATRTYSRREGIRFGLHGMVGHLAPLETFRLDQLALGLFFPPGLLGVYVVAKAFTNLPGFVAQSIGFVAFPAIAEKGHRYISSRTILRYVLALSAVALPVIGLLTFFMPELVGLLFGSEFTDAVPLARILLIGAVFGSLRKVIVEALRGFSSPLVSTHVELLSFPVLVLLGVLLVPAHGAVGMAITVAVTNFFGLIAAGFFWMSKDTRIINE